LMRSGFSVIVFAPSSVRVLNIMKVDISRLLSLGAQPLAQT
jgi:hypothetical protein